MIRHATEADLDRIVEMGRRFLATSDYGTWSGDGMYSPEALAAVARTCLTQGAIFLWEVDVNVIVGEDLFPQQMVVGMLLLYVAIHPLTGKPYGDEIAWWVEPEFRRGRAAYYLLRSAEEWARQNGLSVLKMVAPAWSPSVATFYTRCDYKHVESVFLKKL